MTPPPDAPPSETNPAALVTTMPFAVASGVEIDHASPEEVTGGMEAVIAL